MSIGWLLGISATLLVTACPALSRAADISTKKLSIKDNTDATKRQLAVQSKDATIFFTDADDPGTHGATLHAYSSTDDFCLVLSGGGNWTNSGKAWKYADASKNAASVGDGKLKVKVKSGVTYTLADNGTQGPVNVQLQFGNGTKYCMRCTTPKKNDGKKYLAKDCAAAACDPEPSACPPVPTTTTTSSTTTTTAPSGHLIGSLTATGGQFNYNMQLGLPGANSACNMSFPGTHVCTYSELQGAQAMGDLVGLKDTSNATVTSFWAIDPNAAPLTQCYDDANFNPNTQPGHNWEYGTAHTGTRGNWVALNNGTGTLGSLQMGQQCNFTSKWVGCCQ